MSGDQTQPHAALASEDELISVVIVNYNRCADLRRALLSVGRQDYPSVEIIVVDNASTDGSIEMLAREFPQVRTIASAENLGMDGYSVGFRESRGRYIFQMDNDSEMPEPTVLTEVARRFREGPANQGVVATRVRDLVSGDPDIAELRREDQRVGPLNLRHYHSGGVGFLRSALDSVGYYNRDVFLYGAENFLEIKFLAAGFAVLYYPEILMLHRPSPTARSTRFLYYTVRNSLWYLRRYATGWQKARYVPLLLLYNFGQGIWKRQPGAYFRAVRDGLGMLPASIPALSGANNEDFTARVERVGQQFGAGNLWKAITSRLRPMDKSL
ncbi:MAG TPA: glycosyltransferase [Humisphaera sp.]|jgi:hypothetical protein|nr:glycosyltransferase [Humisphaera sp.]